MTENEEQTLLEKTMKSVISLTASEKGSGIMLMMKPEYVKCSAKEKSLTIYYDIEKWELNPQGIMHGGMLTTAIDNTYGTLTHYYAGDKFITTIELSMHFLKPLHEGDRLEITVKADHVGKTIINLSAAGKINNKNNVLAVTSSATYMIINNIRTDINKISDGQMHIEKI
ncbi:MAG: PaaI family thioesterase [Clostridia bacterium]|jgi:uncharacterized protein (TIGR00369 family)|nr:PaaI family thioesterase [Clostridia bacterium]MCI1999426.1 PaaI family thioesterase [Clostridia bacterium]MCI2015072.1 PaaI family thioesterase [Clostridia bacterium]